ncbi:Multidrug resistance-associated protein 1 [Lobulomyces angularis]|nr:Multidrug resistance-associated protein 1 [Lobulomyces angularis]
MEGLYLLIASFSIEFFGFLLQHLPFGGKSGNQKVSPEENANFLSSVSFSWYTKLQLLGRKKTLDYSDIWNLPERLSNKIVYSIAKPEFQKSKSLLRSLWKSFGLEFSLYGLYRFFITGLNFSTPNLVKAFLTAIASPDSDRTYNALAIGLTLFAVSFLSVIFTGQYNHGIFKTELKVRGALALLVYDKALTLKCAGSTPDPKIYQHMSTDVINSINILPTFHLLWSSLLELILGGYLLYQLLGSSCFSIIGALVIVGAIVAVCSPGIAKHQKAMMTFLDERVKVTSSLVTQIKCAKLYAYEKLYLDKIFEARTKELHSFQMVVKWLLGIIATFHSLPGLLALLAFSAYAAWATDRPPLTSTIIFPALTILNLIHQPFATLATGFGNILTAKVSIERIIEFLKTDELNRTNANVEKVESSVNSNIAVEFDNCTVRWPIEDAEKDKKKKKTKLEKKLEAAEKKQEKKNKVKNQTTEKVLVEIPSLEPALQNISFKIPVGEVMVILGRVGSGKSALVNAILGEMNMISKSKATVMGTTSFAPQTPWILNSSIRENILFGSEYDEEWYDKVIEACALTHDFSILTDGDRTLVGDKGISLSGGQKQRIGTARAVYAKKDIVILDDPLSAVDSHVGKQIFENVISSKPKSLLKDKTRIIVTNAVKYLSEFPTETQIIFMADGKITEQGSLQKLLELKGNVWEMVNIGNETRSSTESNEDGEKLTEESVLEEVDSNDDIVVKGEEMEVSSNEEELRSGAVSKEVYFSYLRTWGKGGLIIWLALLVFTGAASLVPELWITIYSQRQEKGLDSPIPFYFGIYAVVTIISALSLACYAWFTLGYLCIKSSKKILSDALKPVAASPMLFFDNTPSGRIINRFSSDASTLDMKIPNEIIGYMLLMGMFINFMIRMVISNIFLLLSVPVMFGFYYLLQIFYLASSRELKRLDLAAKSPLYQTFGETIDGLTCIRAFGADERFKANCVAHLDKSQDVFYLYNTGLRWLEVNTGLVGALPVLFVVLASIYQNNDPSFTGLGLVAVMTLSETLIGLVFLFCNLENDIISVERLLDYSKLPSEGTFETDPNLNLKPEWPLKGEITFTNYSTKYREDLDPVLKNLSLTVKSGEKIGVVGRTGAGKSTISMALFRIINASEGSISIDGVDISKIGLTDLRSRMTIIPQDPYIFTGTLRANLDPESKNSDDKIWLALESVGLKSFVTKTMKEGLESLISDGGSSISIGQRQLICLARAILRKTKILLLDEATASVDVQTDEMVQLALSTELKDCTVITIAHRINTIVNSDRILVLDNGYVAQFDAPNKLLKDPDGMYSGLPAKP